MMMAQTDMPLQILSKLECWRIVQHSATSADVETNDAFGGPVCTEESTVPLATSFGALSAGAPFSKCSPSILSFLTQMEQYFIAHNSTTKQTPLSHTYPPFQA